MTATDRALLEAEWVMGSRWPACPVCEGPQPGGGHEQHLARGHEDYKGGHQPGCSMDEALSERGFATQRERNIARERMRAAVSETEPAPAEEPA